MQGSFSLMVFGWTQIVMDIQPLIVIITGAGHLHGFSHTYLGATLIALFSGLTGKYLSELGLKILRIGPEQPVSIGWGICLSSAFIGSFSHVLLDSIMHADLQPFYPIVLDNQFLGLISIDVLHRICLYSGLVGAALYYLIYWTIRNKG